MPTPHPSRRLSALFRPLTFVIIALIAVVGAPALDASAWDWSEEYGGGPFHIRNSWMGLQYSYIKGPVDHYDLAGVGPRAGQTLRLSMRGIYQEEDRVEVHGIPCPVLTFERIDGEVVVESVSFFLAQDLHDDVRLLKVAAQPASGEPVEWTSPSAEAAPVFLSHSPEPGQRFEWFDGHAIEVVGQGEHLPRTTTGLGPYGATLRLRWTSPEETFDFWLVVSVGLVRVDSVEGEAVVMRWERTFDPFTCLDRDLRSAVAEALSKPSGTLTLADLASLEVLSYEDGGHPTGLQMCDNLRQLSLSTRYGLSLGTLTKLTRLERLEIRRKPLYHSDEPIVRGLDVLSGMTNLKHLALVGLGLRDIPQLSALTGLETLDLSHNRGFLLEALVPLKNLRELYLADNRVSYYTALRAHDRLEVLDLSSNYVDSLEPMPSLRKLNVDDNDLHDELTLAAMPRLEEFRASGNRITGVVNASATPGLRIVDLSHNRINDVSGLAVCPALEQLDLSGNRLSDAAPLAAMTALVDLRVDLNALTDIGPVANLGGLRTFTLNRNFVTDLSPVAGLGSLVTLEADDNLVTTLPQGDSLPSLTTLSLAGNHIENPGPLAGLVRIEWLSLDRNRIADAVPLGGLVRLRVLTLSDNPLGDIGPLARLTELRQLDLSRTGIDSIAAVASMSQLQSLALDGNWVTDLSPLAGLIQLDRLSASRNAIESIEVLGGLDRLNWLDVSFNTIDSIEVLGYVGPIAWLDVAHNQIDDVTFLETKGWWPSCMVLTGNPLTQYQVPTFAIFDGPESLEIDVAVDCDWTYENAPVSTGDRNGVALAIDLLADPYGNEGYTVTVEHADGSEGQLRIVSTESPYEYVLLGPEVGAGKAGLAQLLVTVSGSKAGRTIVPIDITVRRVGDIFDKGWVNNSDKMAFDIYLNGGELGSFLTEADLDVNGDGVVDARDQAILILQSFGQPIP